MLEITKKNGYRDLLVNELESELFNSRGLLKVTLQDFLNDRSLSPNSSIKEYAKDINGFKVISIKFTGLLHNVIILINEVTSKLFMSGNIGPSSGDEDNFFFVTNISLSNKARDYFVDYRRTNLRRMNSIQFTPDELASIKYKDWPKFLSLIN